MSAVAPGLVPVWMVDYPDHLDNVTTQANPTFTGSSGDQISDTNIRDIQSVA